MPSTRRHFCCCIPVRLGALLFTFSTALLTALVSAGIFYSYSRLTNPDDDIRVAALVVGSLYATLALAGVLGVVGCLGAWKGAVKAFGWTMIGYIIAIIAASTWGIIRFYNLSGEQQKRCEDAIRSELDEQLAKLNNATSALDQSTQDLKDAADHRGQVCRAAITAMKYGLPIVAALTVLFLCWITHVARAYQHQLEDKEASRRAESHVLNSQYQSDRPMSKAYQPLQDNAAWEARYSYDGGRGGYNDPYHRA